MTKQPSMWRVLLVEDDSETAAQVQEWFDGLTVREHHVFEVDHIASFDDAMGRLEKVRYDVVVLDIYRGPARVDGDDAGRRLLQEIQARRFVPVIFYTALPNEVAHLRSPVIQVIEKGSEDLERLQAALIGFLESRLLQLARGFSVHVDQVFREYLWDFVPKHWDQFGASPDKVSLAYVLCRRLAASLEQAHIGQLTALLGIEVPDTDAAPGLRATETCHPAQMYIVPPLDRPLRTGDILRKEEQEESTHWVVLTPTCDILLEKAENLILAKCLPVCAFPEFSEWQENRTEVKEKKLRLLLQNKARGRQRDRYCYLPAVFEVPDLVVDFQFLEALPRERVVGYEKIASLDSPFAEALAQKFVRYIGRIGTPNLDIEAALSSLQDGTDRL